MLLSQYLGKAIKQRQKKTALVLPLRSLAALQLVLTRFRPCLQLKQSTAPLHYHANIHNTHALYAILGGEKSPPKAAYKSYYVKWH